jgi:hypothetical protein
LEFAHFGFVPLFAAFINLHFRVVKNLAKTASADTGLWRHQHLNRLPSFHRLKTQRFASVETLPQKATDVIAERQK